MKQRLRRTSPLADALDDRLRSVAAMRFGPQVDCALWELLADVVASPAEVLAPLPRRAARSRLGLPALVGVAVLGVGGAVATAAAHQAHTGGFGLPGSTENDTSEYLDKTAPDFLATVNGYAEGADFAPGSSADQYVGNIAPEAVPGLPSGRQQLTQVTGVKGDIAGWAFCSWQRTWHTARAGADTAGQTAALAHMRSIAALPEMGATNRRRTALQLVDAAAAGDPQPMETYLQTCPLPKAWPR